MEIADRLEGWRLVIYVHEEEIDRGDVAYVLGGLASDTVNALDRVGLRRAARHPSEPP